MVLSFFRRSDTLRREGRLVILPSRGAAIICSDLHGHVADFEAVLARSEAEQRLQDGENLFLVFTGDVPDTARHRQFDGEVTADGDVQIIERLMALSERWPDRVLYVEGNHDFHLARLRQELQAWCQSRGRTPPERDRAATRTLLSEFFADYQDEYGLFLFRNNIAPYDMFERVTDKQVGWLTSGPVLALMPGAKVAVTHAGPVRSAGWQSPRELLRTVRSLNPNALANLTPEDYYSSAYHQLLNNRFRNGDYNVEDLAAFCEALSVSTLVTGHTPHSYLQLDTATPLPQCRLESGLGIVGERQVVLCSSFGALGREAKSYLEIDLGRALDGPSALRPGVEIHRLYPPDGEGRA